MPHRYISDGNPSGDLYLTSDACRALADRTFAMASGGGTTDVIIDSAWNGETRWSRNRIKNSSDRQQTKLSISRTRQGAWGNAGTNTTDDPSLRTMMGRAESLMAFHDASRDTYPDPPRIPPPYPNPTLWFDDTLRVNEAMRSEIAQRAIATAQAQQLQCAGYLQVGARGYATVSTRGMFRYSPSTTAQYSVTVRDPIHGGSGWAGIDHQDWHRIDPEYLTQCALDKCLRSRNPAAIEPGRYSVILEAQAVCDLAAPLIDVLDRRAAENGIGPFASFQYPGQSRIGEHVLDPRLTLGVDPMDPDGGFVPFDDGGEPYQAVRWIDHGVLKELSYDPEYAIQQLGKDRGLGNPGAFRLSCDSNHGMTTVEDMVAQTLRGVLVTRFHNIQVLDLNSMLLTGNTRDGVWLIEHGKITKAVKNLRFVESPLFVLNKVDAIGMPVRTFHPTAPAVVPPLLVHDFNFVSALDAV